jgi:hypothetical protein
MPLRERRICPNKNEKNLLQVVFIINTQPERGWPPPTGTFASASGRPSGFRGPTFKLQLELLAPAATLWHNAFAVWRIQFAPSGRSALQ